MGFNLRQMKGSGPAFCPSITKLFTLKVESQQYFQSLTDIKYELYMHFSVI